jgi:hypothetical protein
LRDVREFNESAESNPSKAIERLAEMGEDITAAFHGDLSTTFGEDLLRTLGSLIFLEAARALDPALRAMRPSAMLRISVLKENRSFALKDYIKGARPKQNEIALTQTLTSAATI